MHPDVARTRGYAAGFNARPPRPPADPKLAAIYMAAYAQGARRR